MLISLIKGPITELGPGKRLGIWTSGCHKNCKGCMSPHAKAFDKNLEMSIESILERVKEHITEHQITGVTISGGEPFDQEDLIELLKGIEALGIYDVLVYTGYYFSELCDKTELLSYIGVLIDGPYIDELNDDLSIRGSSNQTVYILNEELSDTYQSYLNLPRSFRVEVEGNIVTVIGLLPKDTNIKSIL